MPEPSKLMMSVLFVLSLILMIFTAIILVMLILDPQMQYLRPRFEVTVITMLIVSLYFIIWSGYRRFTSIKYTGATLRPLSHRDAITLLAVTLIISCMFIAMMVIYSAIHGFDYVALRITIFVLIIFAVMSVTFQLARLLMKEPMRLPRRKHASSKKRDFPILRLIARFATVIIYLTILAILLYELLQPKIAQSVSHGWLFAMLGFSLLWPQVFGGYSRTKPIFKSELVSQKHFKIFLAFTFSCFAGIGAVVVWRLTEAMRMSLADKIESFFMVLCMLFFYHFWLIYSGSFILSNMKELPESKAANNQPIKANQETLNKKLLNEE